MRERITIRTLDSWGEGDGKFIFVDRNVLGEIFLYVKDKNTIADLLNQTCLELDRENAFLLATEIMRHLVLYPNDQVRRLEEGHDCACYHKKEMKKNGEEI